MTVCRWLCALRVQPASGHRRGSALPSLWALWCRRLRPRHPRLLELSLQGLLYVVCYEACQPLHRFFVLFLCVVAERHEPVSSSPHCIALLLQGYGFVTMVNYTEALQAISMLNGHMIGPRALQVLFLIFSFL
jgi:hypothetical protein